MTFESLKYCDIRQNHIKNCKDQNKLEIFYCSFNSTIILVQANHILVTHMYSILLLADGWNVHYCQYLTINYRAVK